jgi:hypothetical protein
MRRKAGTVPINAAADRNLCDWSDRNTRTASRSAARSGRSTPAKNHAAPDVIGIWCISGMIKFATKTQPGDTKPKVRTGVPCPFSAFSPYFSANLHPILGVPVRRLWK